ncbi:hypothetical protein Arub01_31260 [Actinomadura rubrobrunea]|uniref:non-specific serine/threonine protein kinase n=1 Tax=Actinomadura rubrobrunea TaxID=115335 RepID=A0A9W6PWC6_9ACTN|nr:hypothetical protein Arub01_31260 [Actinomadura rubrobrunea]
MLAERYRLDDLIGRGGMGAVWRSWDAMLDRWVAVKEVSPPDGLSEADVALLHERVLREARAAARLDHPAIVPVHDVIIADGRPWIVMKLVNGRSLDQVVRENGPLPPERVARIGVQVLDALRAAHAQGVLHRDVTPRNVLLSEDGRALLTDFGIAAVSGTTRLTQTGELVGSPGYMAPERLRGDVGGPESDLWSLGATLYKAVEGEPAYRADELAALVGAVLTQEPAPMRRAGQLAPLVMSLLARDPAHRPSAEQARAELERVAAGGPAAAMPVAPSPAAAASPEAGAAVQAEHGIDIRPNVLPVFGFASLGWTFPMLLLAFLAALKSAGWRLDQVPLTAVFVPLGGGLVFGLLMTALVARQRCTMRSSGLTLRAFRKTAEIPASAIRGVGIVSRAMHRYLVVWFDPRHVAVQERPLKTFLRQGRKVTKTDGVLGFGLSFCRPPAADIRAYVEGTGLAPWLTQ